MYINNEEGKRKEGSLPHTKEALNIYVDTVCIGEQTWCPLSEVMCVCVYSVQRLIVCDMLLIRVYMY